MKTASKYWNLVRLDSSGKLIITEISLAKKFFQQQFPNLIDREAISDLAVQRDLIALKNIDREVTGVWAERCLRCFISHQIRQVCIQLEMQFSREHGFTRNDLYIYTLNDTLDNFRDSISSEKISKSQYKPLAVEILETFDPQKANLSTWTTRLVKQNRELQRFLLEQGVYLVSNWAILNDTNLKQVNRILSEFYNLTPTEIDLARRVLESYHAVYRQDRLKNRRSKGKKCQTPSSEQLERIASLINKKVQLAFSARQTLSQLEQLAGLLREYRIYVKGGRFQQVKSLDNSEINTEAIQASVVSSISNDNSDCGCEASPKDSASGRHRSDFLKSYQKQFQQSLDRSIEYVISTRLGKFKGKKASKAPQFLTALELFHCQGESMSEIAPIIGLQAQYQVTRLLKLKELRADIRHKMLQLMGDWILIQTKFEDPKLLKQREQEIEAALGEQIDLVLEEAEKEVSIADSTQSILAKHICDYLHRQST